MPHKHSRLRSVAMVCQDPDKAEEKYLVARIQIECEVCGPVMEYQIMGHHLPGVVKALQKIMELHPELVKEHVTEVPQGTTLVMPPEGGRKM